MSIILKATVQADIDAATTATPSTDLAILRVTGERLGCDMTNLNTVSAALADMTVGSESLIELAKRAKALVPSSTEGGGGTTAPSTKVTTTLPFDVVAGDIIYADDFGVLFKNTPHNASTSILNVASSDKDILLVGEGSVNKFSAGFSNGFAYKTTLPNGNVFIAVGGPSTALYSRVLSPDLTITLGTSVFQLINAGSEIAQNFQTIGIFQTSVANQYAFYYLSEFNSTDWTRYMLRRALITYTPANHTVSVATPTTIFSNPSGLIVEHMSLPKISSRYVLLTWRSGSNYFTGSLDTFTGTVTQHTFFNTQIPTYLAEFTAGDGIQRWLIRRSGFVHMLRGDSAASDTVPTTVSILIGPTSVTVTSSMGDFLITSTAAGVYRLVKFSNDASSATIFNIGVDGSRAYSSAPTGIVKNLNEYGLVQSTGDTLLSFSWDGSSISQVYYKGRDYHGFSPVIGVFDLRDSANVIFASGQITNSLFWTQATLSSLVNSACSPMGVADAASSAGVPVSITISSGAVPCNPLVYRTEGLISAFGYRQLNPVDYLPSIETYSWFEETNAVSFGIVNSTLNTKVATAGSGIYSDSGGYFAIACNGANGIQLNIRPLLRRGMSTPVTANTVPLRATVKINHPVVIFASSGSTTVTKLGGVR